MLGLVGRAWRTWRAKSRLIAPIWNSPPGLILSSGPKETFDEVKDTLQRMTGEVWDLGDNPGRAASYKLFGSL